MKLSSRRSPYLVAAGVLSIFFGLTGAWSETAKTIKVVVPYPAGGTATSLLVFWVSRSAVLRASRY
jgi:hypothetical protein